MKITPEAVFFNARIYTVDEAEPWAEALAVYNGKVAAIGSNDYVRSFSSDGTRMIDLEGRLVLPGLCDAHIHFYEWCLSRREVALADTRSKDEMLARIAERAAATPAGEWITGRGWNESRWGETAFPTRADLDPVTPDHPAIFWRADMHGAVANSAAIARAGVTRDTPNPPGGVIEHDERGELTGVFKELAIALVARHVPKADGPDYDPVLREGTAALHRMGITAVHDQRMKDHDDGPRSLRAYQRLERAGDLRLRMATNIAVHQLDAVVGLGLQTGFGGDRLRLGHVKVFADGSLGSRTAWMLEPFIPQPGEDPNNTGVVLTPPDEMARDFRRAAEAGLPISVHAIGDRALRTCLDIFDGLAADGLMPSVPHRIEHAQTLHPDDLPRLAALNVSASVQPIHATDDMDTADLLLGERGAHMYIFRSLAESGALLALGSDAPVADANPFLGIHAALFRQRPERMGQPAWYPNERLSLAETIRGYTLGAAEAAGWQDEIGSLEVGKRADFAVLDRDLFALVEQEGVGAAIAETQVAMTVFDGEIVWAG